MSIYAAQGQLEVNYEFRQRVRSCVVQETNAWEGGPTKTVDEIVTEIMPNVAASPGFANMYLYGEEASDVPPGQDAVTDSDILATVQPMLDYYKPASPPLS